MLMRAVAVGCRTGLSRVASSTVGLQFNAKLLQQTRFMVAQRMVATSAPALSAAPGDHSGLFKLERVAAASMVPLLAASYVIHNPVMDMALAVALSSHIYWGLYAVSQDYGRPIILGEGLAKVFRGTVMLACAMMFLGLIHFNIYDVGITRAMEMLWTL